MIRCQPETAAHRDPSGVIDQDSLTALDALLWLRTGSEVKQRFGYSLSQISRRCHRCQDTFGVAMERVEGEWRLMGDTRLLALQRQVHQWARWQGRQPLRLEATYWSGPLLCTPAPEPWLLGLANSVGVDRNLQLLRERIVVAFVAGLPDIPDPDDTELTTVALSSMPVFFVARADHPLVGQANLTLEQIAGYPSLALPEGCYPLVQPAGPGPLERSGADAALPPRTLGGASRGRAHHRLRHPPEPGALRRRSGAPSPGAALPLR